MDPRHGIATESSERAKDDWVDLGREEELHSSLVLSHDTNGNNGSEHEENSTDIVDGSRSGHTDLEEHTNSASGK